MGQVKDSKNKYKPSLISTKTVGDTGAKLVHDGRCNPPYLVYGFYTKATPDGSKMRSQDLLWWWGPSEAEGLKALNNLLQKENKPNERRTKPKRGE